MAKLLEFKLVVLLGAMTLVGCSESPLAVESSPDVLPQAAQVSSLDQPLPGHIQVCKVGPPGTYSFAIEASGGWFDPFADVVVPGPCVVVWDATADHDVSVTVTEVDASQLDSIQAVADRPVSITEGRVEVVVNRFHGATFTYFNSEVLECSACRGGVTDLTLRYTGPSGNVVIQEGKNVIFDGFVGTGETFTLNGQKKDGKLGKEIKIRVDGGPETKIHTSCSKPIGPGQQFGAFEVVEAFSKDGGRICPPGKEEPCDDLCDAGKAAALTMLLTGDDCSATSHSQDENKVSCVDFGPLTGDLLVVVTDKENPEDSKARTWFDGTVSVGDEFEITAASGGESKLKANTWVNIYLADGTLLQTIKFHTSCSQPLELDDQFGGLRLTGFTPESGGGGKGGRSG